jgi:ATP-dependent 26S proteasome regulatory subunit
VRYHKGPTDDARTYVLINRHEVVPALAKLREFFAHRPKRLHVIGGDEIPLDEGNYDWQRIVLAPEVMREVQEDFERFLRSEPWFRQRRMPWRRSYLLHGPPGNGKTSVARVMASHPAITAYGLNFSMEGLDDQALTELFGAAGRTPPSLVIVEDLDRLYGREADARPEILRVDNRTAITLPHLLNCLDGLHSADGVIVVATANHPRDLDPALRRRFNVVGFPPPTADLRVEYFRRHVPLGDAAIALAAQKSEGFSFAELAETYQAAGMRAFARHDEITPDDLTVALGKVRRGMHAHGGTLQLPVGFGASRTSDE